MLSTMQPSRTRSISIIAALLGLLAPAWAQTTGLRALVYQGCYSSAETFVKFDTFDFQSDGHCQEECVKLGKPVIGLQGSDTCYCGDLLPVAANQVDDTECDFPCRGFPEHMCMWDLQSNLAGAVVLGRFGANGGNVLRRRR